MAAAIASGVARAGANGSTRDQGGTGEEGTTVESGTHDADSLLQGRKISHDVLDLLGRQDGLAVEGLGDPLQAGRSGNRAA